MFDEFMKSISSQMEALQFLLLLVNGLIHIIFAGAVAKDSGQLDKTGQTTMLVPGLAWAFATLLGGVFVAAVYWILHHSKLTRA